MKRKIFLAVLLLILIGFSGVSTQVDALALEPTEVQWLSEHKGETFTLGLSPYSGMDYFVFQGKKLGYIHEIARLLEAQTGIRIKIVADSWSTVSEGLKNGSIDILFGANPTPERLKTMVFTEPIHDNPYDIFTQATSDILTLGDLDGRRVGFIESDFVIDEFAREYPHISLKAVTFPTQNEGFQALVNGSVDCFISSGGGIRYEYLNRFPEIRFVTEMPNIHSAMTLSTLKENQILCRIMDAVIADQKDTAVAEAINQANVQYNRKALGFTAKELQLLNLDKPIVVGMADDYLPYDYMANGEYRGIIGAYLNRITEITGLRFQVKHDTFSNLYQEALAGRVDVLNLAKTPERVEHFIFPRPLNTERDIILGRISSPAVQDVYGLEGKRVAVIEGFWHEEYLRKNLRQVDIVITKDLRHSLKLLKSGQVDYLIENPTVVEYYVNGLGYTQLVKRGVTSANSFVYLGITKHNPELASIIDKVLPLISFDEMKYRGIQTVPPLRHELSAQLVGMILILILIIFGILLIMRRVLHKLIEERLHVKILKEKESLMYADALTGLHNRAYYMDKGQQMAEVDYPQGILMADLNNLKMINDTWGHQKGDELLITFGDVLKSCVPQGVLYRLGGDEFMALVPLGTAKMMETLVSTVQERCFNTKIPMADGVSIRPCVALGWSLRETPEQTLEHVISEADSQMYCHKEVFKTTRQNCWTAGGDKQRLKRHGCACDSATAKGVAALME